MDSSDVHESGGRIATPLPDGPPPIPNLWNQPITTALRQLTERGGPLHTFFSLTGGSILYCLSALSITYGVTRIIGPVLAQSMSLREVLPCFFALSLYELAVLAVLVLIVVLRNVTDDAISLMVIAALFMVAAGLTLGTASPAGPDICLRIGLVCTLLGVVKLCIMRKWVGFAITRTTLFGMTLILGWNFLAGSLIGAHLMTGRATPETLRHGWLAAWAVLLGGTAVIVIDAIRSVQPDDDRAPTHAFLHRPAMVWLFILIVLLAAGYHQYGLAHMFAIDWTWGDFVPLVCIVSLLALEFMRSLGWQGGYIDLIPASIPLVVMAIVLHQGAVVMDTGIASAWQPAVTLGLMSLALCCMAVRRWSEFLMYAAGVYALATLLTLGYNPQDPLALNWTLAGAGLVTALIGLGIIRRNPVICFAAIAILSVGATMIPGFAGALAPFGLTGPGAAMGLGGLGTIVVCLVFGRGVHEAIRVCGAFALVVFAFDWVGPQLTTLDAVMTIAMLSLASIFWLRTHDIFAPLILTLPVLWKTCLLARAMSSWGYVALSFLLLFLGAGVSLFRKRMGDGHKNPQGQVG